MMGQLQVNNLNKTLGNRLIIDNVSFSVDDGEFFVLLGPSGCGKSTLLRLICGLEQPDSGTINLNGSNITQLPPRERNLGMVFQDYGLYPNMDVYGNIAYGLEARGVNKAEIERRIKPAAEKLGLTALLERNIGDISGGEQQRVALARAMVKDADSYLYDEPLSNLDPKLRHKARTDIMAVHRAKGKPSVYVTHDQSEAFAMANRICVLSGGRVQQIGTADELLTAPANTFVAGFIGAPATNLLNGEITRRDGHLAFRSGSLVIPLPAKWEPILAQSSKVAVIGGIRPSAIQVTQDPLAPRARVNFIELLLGEQILGLTFGEGRNLTAQVSDSEVIEEGAMISIAIDPEQVSLFDPDTTQALA